MNPDEENAEYRRRARESLLETTLPRDDIALTFGLKYLEGLKPWTARTRSTTLRRYFDWCVERDRPVFDIFPSEAKIYLASLSEGLAPATKYNICSAVGSFYVAAIDERLCGSNPFRGVHPEVVTNRHDTPALSIAEIRRVYADDASRRKKPGYGIVQERNFYIFRTMNALGPRRAETVHLCWGDEIVESGRTHWRFLGKGGGYANTALSKSVEADMFAWRARLEADAGRPMRPDDPIFPRTSSGGKRSFRLAASRGCLEPLKPDTLTIIYKDLLDKANVGVGKRRYSPHSARATAITQAHEHGVSDREIMFMSRHKTIANLYRYIRTPPGPSPADSWSAEIDDEGEPDDGPPEAGSDESPPHPGPG